MRTFPSHAERGEFAVLVIRTDYGDEAAWQAVVSKSMEPWGSGDYEADVYFVSDAAWSGASVDEVLAVVTGDEYLDVVFLADKLTMHDGLHALLAVTTVTRADYTDDEDYESTTRYGRQFRTVPAEIHSIHVNLALGNMGFEEFAQAAAEDEDGTFRSFD